MPPVLQYGTLQPQPTPVSVRDNQTTSASLQYFVKAIEARIRIHFRSATPRLTTDIYDTKYKHTPW